MQNLAMYALVFELPAYLAAAAGLDARAAGRTLLALMGAMVVASPLGGRLGDRIGARRTVLLGALSAASAMAALAFVTASSPALLPLLAVVGAGLGLSTAPSQAAALGAVPPQKSGMAAAAMSTSRYLGGVAGVASLGAVLAHLGAEEGHPFAIGIFCASLLASALAASALPGSMPRRAPA